MILFTVKAKEWLQDAATSLQMCVALVIEYLLTFSYSAELFIPFTPIDEFAL